MKHSTDDFKDDVGHDYVVDVVIVGILSLLITVGVSRFGFGTIISHLIQDNGFTDIEVGLIGSFNLIGYLLGCLIMVMTKVQRYTINLLIFSVFVSVLTVCGTYFINDLYLWYSLRFLNGLVGGVAFIVTSVFLVEMLLVADKLKYSLIIYSGVGLGIFLSSIATVITQPSLDSILFIHLSICIVLFLVFFQFARKIPDMRMSQKVSKSKISMFPIMAVTLSYALEGMGYIIYATYIFPYYVKFDTEYNMAFYSWLLIGVGAAFGPFIVSIVSKYIQIHTVIIYFFAGQALSILLTLVTNNPVLIVFSSFVFGFTFMGLTAAYIVYMKMKWPEIVTSVAVITLAYSIGQAVGPILGGYFNEISGGYERSIELSIVLVFISLIMFGISSTSKLNKQDIQGF